MPRSRLLVVLLVAATCVMGGPLTDRWFFLSRGLDSDADVTASRELCTTAAQHGYTGVCWSGVENALFWSPAQLGRLAQVKQVCADLKLEIIPLVYSVGYGGAALQFDPTLAVGIPVERAPFQVAGGRATLAADPALAVPNGGFEEADGDQLKGWGFHDKPGQVTFVDHAVKHGGGASLRLENPGAKGLGPHARVMASVKVQPHRRYRFAWWAKAEAVVPRGACRVQIYGGKDGPNLTSTDIGDGTFDWRRQTLDVNSGPYDLLRIYLGSWEGRSGTFWLDDTSLTEVGLQNLLRRDGCPLTVTSEDGQTTYAEGRDFKPVADTRLLDFGERPGPAIELLPDSRVAAGARLAVSWYHAARVAHGQISVCMSAPRLYEYFEAVAKKLAEVLPSRKFLLSMDEIREGGTDLADKRRGLTMGQILADCITRQQMILRRHHPGAICYIWSDMLDPGHNSHGDYYLVEGSFAGAVNGVPKDLVMACWWGEQCERSLKFFEERGFKTLGAAYYDTDDLVGSRRWQQALAATPGAIGIMYTTWQSKYGLLAAFGDMVRP